MFDPWTWPLLASLYSNSLRDLILIHSVHTCVASSKLSSIECDGRSLSERTVLKKLKKVQFREVFFLIFVQQSKEKISKDVDFSLWGTNCATWTHICYYKYSNSLHSAVLHSVDFGLVRFL